MENETPMAWPVRRRMPDLTTLDEPARAKVTAAVERLRTLREVFGDRFLAQAREHVPGYSPLSDEEIRASARRFMDILLAELSSLRVPDAALREVLGEYAAERVARGVPLDAVSIGYQLGSREMLALLDQVAADVDLPPGLLLAVHDSTWEFANEAASVFARVKHRLVLEQAHFDAERRSAYAGGVLGGAYPAERINRDAAVFGLDPQAHHVALAARAASAAEADAVRRAIARAVHLPRTACCSHRSARAWASSRRSRRTPSPVTSSRSVPRSRSTGSPTGSTRRCWYWRPPSASGCQASYGCPTSGRAPSYWPAGAPPPVWRRGT
ncbi:hypothetical protein GCM10020295_19680 [Streptomyces cinereospinus]